MANINIPIPELQISFSKILQKIRETYLQEALSNTIDTINLLKLDNELNEFVPEKYLKALAKNGLRGGTNFSSSLFARNKSFPVRVLSAVAWI
jgi:hypothetical protein